jgi:hypothetical protein
LGAEFRIRRVQISALRTRPSKRRGALITEPRVCGVVGPALRATHCRNLSRKRPLPLSPSVRHPPPGPRKDDSQHVLGVAANDCTSMIPRRFTAQFVTAIGSKRTGFFFGRSHETGFICPRQPAVTGCVQPWPNEAQRDDGCARRGRSHRASFACRRRRRPYAACPQPPSGRSAHATKGFFRTATNVAIHSRWRSRAFPSGSPRAPENALLPDCRKRGTTPT